MQRNVIKRCATVVVRIKCRPTSATGRPVKQSCAPKMNRSVDRGTVFARTRNKNFLYTMNKKSKHTEYMSCRCLKRRECVCVCVWGCVHVRGRTMRHLIEKCFTFHPRAFGWGRKMPTDRQDGQIDKRTHTVPKTKEEENV